MESRGSGGGTGRGRRSPREEFQNGVLGMRRWLIWGMRAWGWVCVVARGKGGGWWRSVKAIINICIQPI